MVVLRDEVITCITYKNDLDFGMQNATDCLNYLSATDQYCGMIGFRGYVKDSPSCQTDGAHTLLCHP